MILFVSEGGPSSVAAPVCGETWPASPRPQLTCTESRGSVGMQTLGAGSRWVRKGAGLGQLSQLVAQ